jgi:hypothetical protein
MNLPYFFGINDGSLKAATRRPKFSCFEAAATTEASMAIECAVFSVNEKLGQLQAECRN